jgi:F420-0:gamma-glutamyl ligase
VCPPRPGQGASPGGGDLHQKQAAAEKRRAARKAEHKKRQIAKGDRNNNRTKRRKAGELGVSSDEDPSLEPSWSGDVASAAVDRSNMSGSSSSSLPRDADVSSSRRLQAAGRDKTVGLSSRQAAHYREETDM